MTTLTAQVVDIRNLGNFTGTYWDDNLGKAQAKVSRAVQRQRRSQGFFADKPNQSATATFDITTDC